MSRILGLDVSTKTIGIAIFEDQEDKGKLQLLTHISPKVKPKPTDNIELLIKKVQVFETEFLEKYSDIGIDRVIIEEPLLRSNNVNTVATLGENKKVLLEREAALQSHPKNGLNNV